jgi:hypothetical protein
LIAAYYQQKSENTMRPATAIVSLGLVLLTMGGLLVAPMVFAPQGPGQSQPPIVHQEGSATPDAAENARWRAELRERRLAMSSFDLTAGLFNWELENIARNSRPQSFFFLVASLWLVFGLKRSRRD